MRACSGGVQEPMGMCLIMVISDAIITWICLDVMMMMMMMTMMINIFIIIIIIIILYYA